MIVPVNATSGELQTRVIVKSVVGIPTKSLFDSMCFREVWQPAEAIARMTAINRRIAFIAV